MSLGIEDSNPINLGNLQHRANLLHIKFLLNLIQIQPKTSKHLFSDSFLKLFERSNFRAQTKTNKFLYITLFRLFLFDHML